MENSYRIGMSLFPNLGLGPCHSGWKLNNLRTESRDLSIRKGQTTLKILHRQWSRRTAYKIRSCIVLKDAFAKKLCCERTSQFYIFVYIQCRRWPTDRLHLKFPFSRRNWRSRSSPFPVNRRSRRNRTSSWFLSSLLTLCCLFNNIGRTRRRARSKSSLPTICLRL